MKGDQMGILAAYPTQRELPLSNQTRFSCVTSQILDVPRVRRQLRPCQRNASSPDHVFMDRPDWEVSVARDRRQGETAPRLRTALGRAGGRAQRSGVEIRAERN